MLRELELLSPLIGLHPVFSLLSTYVCNCSSAKIERRISKKMKGWVFSLQLQ